MGFSPMHPVPDCDYILSRAEAELQMAESAADPKAAEAHRALAGAYLARLFSEDRKEPGDLWRWLRTAREKRQALRSIFAPDLAPMYPPAGPLPEETFSDLLGRLGDNFEGANR